MTDRVYNVCTDSARIEEFANNSGYAIKNVHGHYKKIRKKR
jgi:hypothetical protein